MFDLNPAYPKDPKTLGERIRKARMDRSMMIKELTALIGVSPDTIINWELRGIKPAEKSLRKLEGALGLWLAQPQKQTSLRLI